MDNIKIIIETNSKLHDFMMSKWLAQDLFSVKWWGVLGFVIISYVICFWLIDKTRLTKTILFGSLVSVFSVVIDITGSSLNLWAYSMYLFPIIPSIFFYDITVLPLYFMLVFQYAGTWKKYMLWMLAASAIMGFVFTPLFVILGLGVLIHWNYLCAFLSFSFIGFLGKVVVSLIFYIEKHYQMKQ